MQFGRRDSGSWPTAFATVSPTSTWSWKTPPRARFGGARAPADTIPEPSGAAIPVREALAAGYRLTRLLVARSAAESTAELRELAGAAGVPVAFVDPGELDALAFGGNHQSVVATLAPTAGVGVRELLQARPGRTQPPLILAADQVEDVGNLGSLLRTLEACGGAGAIVPARRSAALTGGLARASAGASLRSTVVTVTNLARELKTLRSGGVRIIGLDADADTAVRRFGLRRAMLHRRGQRGAGDAAKRAAGVRCHGSRTTAQRHRIAERGGRRCHRPAPHRAPTNRATHARPSFPRKREGGFTFQVQQHDLQNTYGGARLP